MCTYPGMNQTTGFSGGDAPKFIPPSILPEGSRICPHPGEPLDLEGPVSITL